jgi:hypothetical protein
MLSHSLTHSLSIHVCLGVLLVLSRMFTILPKNALSITVSICLSACVVLHILSLSLICSPTNSFHFCISTSVCLSVFLILFLLLKSTPTHTFSFSLAISRIQTNEYIYYLSLIQTVTFFYLSLSFSHPFLITFLVNNFIFSHCHSHTFSFSIPLLFTQLIYTYPPFF